MRCPDRHDGRVLAWTHGAASCLLVAALAACSSQLTAAGSQVDDHQAAAPAAEQGPTTSASPARPGPPAPAAPTAVTPPADTPTPATTSTPADVTQEAAGRFVPTPGAPAPAAAAVAPGVDYADAQAVARGYVGSRLTYRFDDPAGYAAALMSSVFTTPAFAVRSAPGAAALARLASSQETSAVVVSGAELEGEAPNTASSRYVVVTCTVTTTYRGGGDTATAAWTLRLLQVAAGQWRVDGVLSTD